MRVWKVAEEKQLLFKAGPGNIDSVVALNDDLFVTGADNGRLNVWNANKVTHLLSFSLVIYLPVEIEKTYKYNTNTQHGDTAMG